MLSKSRQKWTLSNRPSTVGSILQVDSFSFIPSSHRKISNPTVMLTKSLIVLIFHFGSGLYFTTKNTVHKICVEKQETFFQSVFEWSKRYSVLEATTICTLPLATHYSLFHDKILPFVKKIYRRHNNLMRGVVWRTLRRAKARNFRV